MLCLDFHFHIKIFFYLKYRWDLHTLVIIFLFSSIHEYYILGQNAAQKTKKMNTFHARLINTGFEPLTVQMHLGLIDRPFVPHNLISTQESPVPLQKFQMAPRFNIWMSSGSKRGTQIYFFFSLKSPSKQTLSRFPNRFLLERDTRLQGILHISQRPHKNSSK